MTLAVAAISILLIAGSALRYRAGVMGPLPSLLILYLVALCPFMGRAATAPSLQDIIDNTLAHDDARQKALQSMQYDQTAAVDQLEDSGKVVRHEVLRMIIRPGTPSPIQIVSVTGDNAPNDPSQADAQAKSRDVEDNKQNFTLRTLVSRFIITLAGQDQIAGNPAYVLAFTPKPNQPYHDETEEVINQLKGRIWISTVTYNVLQTEASLVHPVSIAWFLASVPTLDFHYSTQDANADFSPSQVRITLKVNAPFVGFHERQTIDMANFRPRPIPPAPRRAVQRNLRRPVSNFSA
jgi:hypothetical protein